MAAETGDFTGKALGTCILEKLIGQGGMSSVYLARQSRPARHVAVKLLRLPSGAESEERLTFQARFRREADIAAHLEHANIIPIFEYGEQDQLAYLVMPYIPGGSLSQQLGKRGRIAPPQALDYLHQAAQALDYAHAHNVVHRDLKPSNFLLYPDGRLVLADFGIAQIVGSVSDSLQSRLTTTGTLLGTPAYMSPEMLLGNPVDYRTDIYAVGIILYQMLSGELPFKGENAYVVINKQIHASLPSLHAGDPTIPLAVDAVLSKATAKNPDERYTSAGELVNALHAAIHTTDPTTYRLARSGPLLSLQETAVPPTMPGQHVNAPLPYPEPALTPPPPPAYAPLPSYTPPPPIQPIQPNNQHMWSRLLWAFPIVALLITIALISWQVVGVFASHPTPSTALTQAPTIPTATPTPIGGNATQPPATLPPTTTEPSPSSSVVAGVTPGDQAKVAVQQYYSYINVRDYQDAYAMLTSEFQADLPYDRFVSGYSQTQRNDVTFNSVTEDSPTQVEISTTLNTVESDRAHTYLWSCTMVQRHSAWQIFKAHSQKVA